jgi:hypothetical protein
VRNLLTRLGMLFAVAALSLGLIAAVDAKPASAADTLFQERSDAPPTMMGPIHTTAHAYKESVWDADEEIWKDVGRIRIKTDIHNPYLFVGYWATVDVRVISQNRVIKSYSPVAMACAVFDPCGSDKVHTWTEPLPVKYLNPADRLEIDHVQLPGRP